VIKKLIYRLYVDAWKLFFLLGGMRVIRRGVEEELLPESMKSKHPIDEPAKPRE
jgi:hypothetical protein